MRKMSATLQNWAFWKRVNEVGAGRPRTFFKYAGFSSKDDDSDKIASSMLMF